MRRNFAQILKDAKIDIKKEYQKLYEMFYDHNLIEDDEGKLTVYDEVSKWFLDFAFRGTCLSFDEFNDLHGFHFERDPADFSIDDLISLCEYLSNMLTAYQDLNSSINFDLVVTPMYANAPFFLEQIDKVIENVGYMKTVEDNMIIFVEKSPSAIAVAESPLIPENFSYRLISYNHYSMKGNLDKKKSVLLQFASILEPQREKLEDADEELKDDLFFAFNNLNIRHNNIDPQPNKKYKAYVAQMTNDALEKLYDEIYQMCLLAILQIENLDRKKEFEELKKNIKTSC